MIEGVETTYFVMQKLFTVLKKSICIGNMYSMFFYYIVNYLNDLILSCDFEIEMLIIMNIFIPT